MYIIFHVPSCVQDHFEALPIKIETYMGSGLPSVRLVGLPDAMVRESVDRVNSSIRSSGLSFPIGKVIINLSPSDIRKEGSHLDLPIALSILGASGQLGMLKEMPAAIGELSLSGRIQPTSGIIPLVLGLCRCGVSHVLVCPQDAEQISDIPGITALSFETLGEVVSAFSGVQQGHLDELMSIQVRNVTIKMEKEQNEISHTFERTEQSGIDYGDVVGQESAKRIMVIAAAGAHHTLLMGPPGVGKTMLVKRLPTIMPELSHGESLEVASIHGIAGIVRNATDIRPPVRMPHYRISLPAFMGGYAKFMPGEISLAHHGVIFMDEFPEFKRDVLESLRLVLDEHRISMKRHHRIVDIPCDFLLIAAANPCPCGWYGSRNPCDCRENERLRYMNRISGPILDRVDLRFSMSQPDISVFSWSSHNESHLTSAEMRRMVDDAITFRSSRGQDCFNARLEGDLLKTYCRLDTVGENLIIKAMDNGKLTLRGKDKIIRISRTISDLAGEPDITSTAVVEALQYHLGVRI